MKRITLLLVAVHILTILSARIPPDTSVYRKIRIALPIDYMGIGYHGYNFPYDNRSLTVSGELLLQLARIPGLKPYASLGLGITTKNHIGYSSFSSGILLGKGVSYCKIGGALAIAFTEHEVYWDRGIHNGGSGTLRIPWGAQVIPTLGYTYLPRNKGLTASLYLSPHFALPTYTAPGGVDQEFWVSAGISLGYLF